MKNIYSLFSALLITILVTIPSLAQSMDNDAGGARMEKIERDLMLLQRQLSRSSGVSSSSTPASGNADFEVRLSTIEDQLREILGKTEENDFQLKKLSQNLDKLQRDTDFRFNELSHAPVASPAVATTIPTTTAASAASSANQISIASKERKIPDENLKVGIEQDKITKPVGKTIDTSDNARDSATVDDTDNDALETKFSSPREHYNYAFRQLNQTQYDKAATSFTSFIKKYPKDPLIGNAYYWQGETFYIRRDYIKAADSFRQGFEELPSGPKAPDNLLKLAMTLDALKRGKEACVVLGQVVAKFKDKSAAVSQKAVQEQKRLDCK